MKRATLFCGLFLFSIVGCTSSEFEPGFSADANLSMARPEERSEGEFLAYEHSIVVDTSEDLLAESHSAVINACAADRENICTVLNSNINHGRVSSASIRMRVKAEGVDALAGLAAGAGEVTSRSTQVEDLAKSIAQIDKRVSILTRTRDRLLELEERGVDDVESLIKITTELTKVQADLEQVLGQSVFQRQRVDTDILSIHFVVEAGRTFWGPIKNSLSSFGPNFSDGIANWIEVIPYLIPWFVFLFLVIYLIRRFWKRGRRKT
ncbi:MAG: DUF4349 domain-containing protein [Gammaproteobacteria bacterium]|nr:DUF4349 domain-containing protein [Gammaproteobacteria bacterium]